MANFDFLTGVNPTLKAFVYILILVHIIAVATWCAIACPGMFKKTETFADKVENALKEKKQ